MTRRSEKKPRPLPPLASVVLAALRKARGWTGEELAEASGISVNLISLHEAGRRPPSRERLEALVTAMGYGVEAIDLVLLGLKSAAGVAEAPRSPVDPRPEELRTIKQLAAQAGVAAADLTERHLVKMVRARRARRARREATRLWVQLRSEPASKRRLDIEKAREVQTWAMAERLCHESEEAASDRADRALELAKLACRVAELAPGEGAWRSRIQGYAQAFLANALRVSSDLPGAEAAFANAWRLWKTGAEADPGLLAEWRLLDREASFHRDRRRFREALERLDQARAASPAAAAARILVSKAATLEQMGEPEKSIEALREAAPLLGKEGEPNLRFALSFNLAVNLCHLGRYLEAEVLLPKVRELAVALGKQLHLVRVVWLEAKVAVGLGRSEEARHAFEQVRRDFTAREMAYDGALVTLELSALLLEQGRMAEVRTLAEEMLWIFRAQGVHREALAALQAFYQAANSEAATAELARQVVRYLYKAQHDPELRFEA